MAKLELAILVGAESKQWLEDFTKQVDRLLQLDVKAVVEDDEPEAEVEAEDDEDFAPKKKAKKKAPAAFEEDEEESDGEDEEPAPKKKSTKAKKLTSDDVNDACKERLLAEKEENGGDAKLARATVQAILKRKFKVDSVADLDEDDYEAVIKAMKA